MNLYRITILAACACFLSIPAACTDDRPAATGSPQVFEKDPHTEVQEQLASNPKNAEAWFHLAELQERSGQYTEEIASLRKVLQLNPKAGYAYLKLGSAYNRTEKYREAIASYQRAAKLLPRNAVLFNNMAYSYGKTGKTQEEITALKQALMIRPSYATARYSLGMAYLKIGMAADAKKEYETLRTYDEGAAKSLKTAIDAR